MIYTGLEEHILSLFQQIFPKIQIEYNSVYDYCIPYLQGFTYNKQGSNTITSTFYIIMSKTNCLNTPIGYLFDTVQESINKRLLPGCSIVGNEEEASINECIYRQLQIRFIGQLPKIDKKGTEKILAVKTTDGETINVDERGVL